MFRGNQEIFLDEEGEFEERPASSGVTYILNDLTSKAEKDFTVTNIANFLSGQKRTYLIKIKKLRIEVTDGISTKIVTPRRFEEGERVNHVIKLPYQDKDISKRGFGEVKAELYSHRRPRKGSKIAVTINGEPIYLDLCQKVDGFNRYPWNNEMVEGTIEYPYLTKQPGRVEVQKDSFFDAFLEMLLLLEKEVVKKVKEMEKKYQTKRDEKLLNKLEDVFSRIRREIDLDIFGPSDKKVLKGSLAKIQSFPEKGNVEALNKRTFYVRAYDNEDNELAEEDGIEFNWRVTGKLGSIISKGTEGTFDAGSIVGATEVTVVAKDIDSQKELSCQIEVAIIHPIKCGPLYRVKIMPGIANIPIGRHREFRAISEDSNGNAISKRVKYYWQIVYDNSEGAKINKDWGETILLTAGKRIGQIKLHLRAQQGKIVKEDFALIDVKDLKKKGRGRKKKIGLPPPRADFDEVTIPKWHSRLDEKEKVLLYNEAHRNYKEVKDNETKRQRYIANLYAKELALIDSKDKGVEHLSERFVEVLSRLDKHWR
jgi:hypothetical protein